MIRRRTMVADSAGRVSEDIERPVEWLKSQLGLPSEASYLGFGLQWVGEDRFLAKGEAGGDPGAWIWTSSVDHARIFVVWKDVVEVASGCDHCRIVLCFDCGDDVWVVPAR